MAQASGPFGVIDPAAVRAQGWLKAALPDLPVRRSGPSVQPHRDVGHLGPVREKGMAVANGRPLGDA